MSSKDTTLLLYEEERRLRRTAEELYQNLRRLLVQVAEALIPEVVDGIRKESPHRLERMSDEDLANLIIVGVKGKLKRLAELNIEAQRFQAAQAKIKELEGEVASLREALRRERELREAVETQLALLKRVAPQPAPEEALPAEPVVLPSWIQQWKEDSGETFERDKIALWVLGSTGVARRMEASALVAKEFGVAPGSGSVVRTFERLKKQGLLEVVEAVLEREGQEKEPEIWHLYRLTEKGKDAFRILFGQEPAPSQTTLLLNKHKSPEHTILILKAADILREAGYQVDVLPESIVLPDGSTYEPDLVAIGETTIFLECETGKAEPGQRFDKWRRCYLATQGNIHVAVPNVEAMRAVRSDILYSLAVQNLTPYTLRIMVLSKATKEALWQDVREQK